VAFVLFGVYMYVKAAWLSVHGMIMGCVGPVCGGCAAV